jgi:hypothetical protein
MAAITSLDASQLGSFLSTGTVLSADDTITLNSGKKQLLVLTNTTGGSLTCTVDGSTGTVVNAPGLPAVSVAAGYAIVVAAGSSRSVMLATISAYCQGVVHLMGAATLTAQLFDI